MHFGKVRLLDILRFLQLLLILVHHAIEIVLHHLVVRFLANVDLDLQYLLTRLDQFVEVILV